MNKTRFNEGLLEFIAESPTPFHAVAAMRKRLLDAGFTELDEAHDWSIKANGGYFVTRNESSIIVFNGLSVPLERAGVRFFGAHTDSPCLKVKPKPEISKKGYLQLGVEVYGGVLLNPWFDRDLSLAGRVTLKNGSGEWVNVLVNWKRPVVMIPSLAIHLDREANSSRTVNPQQHLPLVVMRLGDEEKTPQFRELVKAQVEKEHPDLDVTDVVDYELSVYDTQPGAVIGLEEEFIASARLDNLLSCYIGLQALLANDSAYPACLVFNDHEEVGSVSAEGADGPFLRSVLLRLLEEESRLHQTIARSLMFSADNAHGIHPNYADRHDENHGPVLNQGPVIKVNVNQRYATNSITSGFYRQLSDELDLPYQSFVVRTDMACGSTIGPISAAKLGVKTLDIGAPQWAMHSVRELCGSDDAYTLFQATKAFFATAELPS